MRRFWNVVEDTLHNVHSVESLARGLKGAKSPFLMGRRNWKRERASSWRDKFRCEGGTTKQRNLARQVRTKLSLEVPEGVVSERFDPPQRCAEV